ncbi:MAG TPA: class I SAM-dependent methyltransferase [Candidatus Elarobacter sp.]|nr:class I SAM-dependent methyltransferase [Candidatus Elarobacter sp.]
MTPPQTNALRTLVELAREGHDVHAAHSKDFPFYEIYERYFAPLRDLPLTILELGVYEGESTKVFSRYFPNARIVAVDMVLRDIDFSAHPNVSYHECNQTNGEALRALVDREAPNGLDIVIDDASHVGWFTQISFYHLFPRLVQGGLYVVEDWTTGYLPDWDDGGPFQRFDVASINRRIPMRIPSHDFGMVGAVKWMLDILGSPYIGGEGAVPAFGPNPLEFVHAYTSTVVMRKWPT